MTSSFSDKCKVTYFLRAPLWHDKIMSALNTQQRIAQKDNNNNNNNKTSTLSVKEKL